MPSSELAGLSSQLLYPLPDGVRPTDGFLLLKVVDADGRQTWLTRQTPGLSATEVPQDW